MNLRFFWPVIQSALADHVRIRIARQDSRTQILLDAWGEHCKIRFEPDRDSIQIDWTESGRWQSKVVSYAEAEQAISELLSR